MPASPASPGTTVGGKLSLVKVNRCPTPGCANFDAPAHMKRGKTGPSRNSDLRYS